MQSLNRPDPQALEFLLTRRSAKAAAMTGPGPTPEEVTRILAAAARVPDHGKLFPWRFIVFEGAAREKFGQVLADIRKAEETLTDEQAMRERSRLLRAPLVVAVVSRISTQTKVPEWEQILSAGAACQNLLLAAHAQGYVATWLTEWYAYHPKALTHLGLTADERMAGFVYIGHSSIELTERPRPVLDDIVSRYDA